MITNYAFIQCNKLLFIHSSPMSWLQKHSTTRILNVLLTCGTFLQKFCDIDPLDLFDLFVLPINVTGLNSFVNQYHYFNWSGYYACIIANKVYMHAVIHTVHSTTLKCMLWDEEFLEVTARHSRFGCTGYIMCSISLCFSRCTCCTSSPYVCDGNCSYVL